jgi:rare lipoprotein A
VKTAAEDGGRINQWTALRVIAQQMNRICGATLLLGLFGLAGCAAQAPPRSQPPEAPPAQSSAAPAFFTETGLASFYGGAQDGNTTASGDTFHQSAFTAAHRTLAFGTVVRVTNMNNGRSVTVSINDRGPHVKGRIIDLSYGAARVLGMRKDGVVPVRLEAFPGDQSPG